jgi:hypothetical protein
MSGLNPVSPEVQKQIDDATKVLHELDPDDGSIVGKSKLYKNYLKNALAYTQAKKDYADAQAAALADPVKAQTWPIDSALYQEKINQAYDAFKTGGADMVERALHVLEAVGRGHVTRGR